MPPGDGEKLTATELASLRRWVEARTPAEEKPVVLAPFSQLTEGDRSFWSFQPPRQSDVPLVEHSDGVRGPIDAFLLAKLEAQGLAFSPETDRGTLIRRAYFDLIGLPPEPAAVEAFVADSRPDAYERLIDSCSNRRITASAGGGIGSTRRAMSTTAWPTTIWPTIVPHEGIWRYRDYVIRAFNEDKPYDRFLTEQLAGDELVDWRRAARLHRRNGVAADGHGLSAQRRGPHQRAAIRHRETLRSGQRSDGHGFHVRARPDDGMLPLPQPQVRSAAAARLLPADGLLRAGAESARLEASARAVSGRCVAAGAGRDRPRATPRSISRWPSCKKPRTLRDSKSGSASSTRGWRRFRNRFARTSTGARGRRRQP